MPVPRGPGKELTSPWRDTSEGERYVRDDGRRIRIEIETREALEHMEAHEDTVEVLSPSRRNAARQRRALWVGFAISAVVHAFLLVGWRSTALEGPGSLAAGPRAGDFRAAAGGGEMVAITIAAPRPIEVPAPPSSKPRVLDPEIRMQEPERQIIAASLTGPTGGGAPGDSRTGPGLKGADGSGAGGNNMEGLDRRTFPTPRSIIPRWDSPDDLKGRRVTFRVHVDSQGEPTGEVEIQPRIADSGFENRLRKDLLKMDFLPGRVDGRPVADWAELTYTF